MDIDSWPPATMMSASPLAICCMPIATVRRPEPQSWFRPHAVFSCGTPAAMAAWRAGFWPWPAIRIWPRITSSTSPPSTFARVERGLDGRGAELVGRRVGEGAVERTDGGARRSHDDDV
jgi:hypothetical protein